MRLHKHKRIHASMHGHTHTRIHACISHKIHSHTRTTHMKHIREQTPKINVKNIRYACMYTKYMHVYSSNSMHVYVHIHKQQVKMYETHDITHKKKVAHMRVYLPSTAMRKRSHTGSQKIRKTCTRKCTCNLTKKKQYMFNYAQHT